MPTSGEAVRRRLQQAAVELFKEQGYEKTTAESIAARAGVTERTYFRHFPDKREVLFDGASLLIERLTDAVAAAAAAMKPLPALRAAFHHSVPLLEENRPVSEPRARVIAATPALQERALAKTASIVHALAAALVSRGVERRYAELCAQVGMDTYAVATDRWMTDPSIDLHAHIDQTFLELQTATNALKTSS